MSARLEIWLCRAKSLGIKQSKDLIESRVSIRGISAINTHDLHRELFTPQKSCLFRQTIMIAQPLDPLFPETFAPCNNIAGLKKESSIWGAAKLLLTLEALSCFRSELGLQRLPFGFGSCLLFSLYFGLLRGHSHCFLSRLFLTLQHRFEPATLLLCSVTLAPELIFTVLSLALLLGGEKRL